MFKLPKDFIDAGYKFEIEIPTPKFETVRTTGGSIALRAWYESNEIEEFSKKAAREINFKVEAAIMDELLRLNGYVPERTCRIKKKESKHVLSGWWECDECGVVYPPCNEEIALWALKYCPHCGAKVVEE